MKKKLLVVCNYGWAYNKFLIPLCLALQNKYEVHLACDKSNEVDNSNKAINKIFNIDILSKIYQLNKLFNGIKQISILVQKNQYDAIISNNRNASLVARLSHIFYFRKNKKLKNIYIARGMYFHDSQPLLIYYIVFFFEVLLSKFTDLILSQTNEDIIKINKFLSKNTKIKYIGNGIDVKKFYQNTKSKNSSFVIGSIARFDPNKGITDLIEAFKLFNKKYTNSKLLLIGGSLDTFHDKYYLRITKIINNYNLSKKIIITGLNNNVYKHLCNIDLYVHPSYREGMPRSVLEAMSMSKIVIATKIRGANEIINDSINGFLYEKKNIISLFNLIEKCFNLETEQKSFIEHNARKTVVQKYSEKEYIYKQFTGIKEILNDNK